LATLLKHFGIVPSTCLGHSVGEFVAATMADVMDLESALRLVATRGRLLQSLPKGSMLSVRLSLERGAGDPAPGVDVATVNGPQLCVVAGPTPTLQALSETLGKDGVACGMLHASHAFHSPMMDLAVEPFLRTVGRPCDTQPRCEMCRIRDRNAHKVLAMDRLPRQIFFPLATVPPMPLARIAMHPSRGTQE
jgi:acyl transferase domain-containing protein